MTHSPLVRAGFDVFAFLGVVVGWLTNIPVIVATAASAASLVYYLYQIHFLRKQNKPKKGRRR